MTGIFECLPVVETDILHGSYNARIIWMNFENGFNNGPVVNVLVIIIILFLVLSGRAFVWAMLAWLPQCFAGFLVC